MAISLRIRLPVSKGSLPGSPTVSSEMALNGTARFKELRFGASCEQSQIATMRPKSWPH